MNPLAKFTNDEIETRLKTLVFKERQLLHIILEHIKEVDSRKLYLARAYSSLYEYLTKELQYSGSAAMRRIEAARLLKEVPAISEKIQDDSLNLTQIGELSRAVKEKEKATGAKVSALQKESLLERSQAKLLTKRKKSFLKLWIYNSKIMISSVYRKTNPFVWRRLYPKSSSKC